MKKTFVAGLCLCMILSMLTGTALAAPSLEEEVLPVLAVMGVINGDENGNLDLSASVTRAQFVKMAVAASKYKTQGQAVSSVSPYPDVPAKAWYSGYITTARDNSYISGYLDGTFRPDNYVTLEEAISVMLKVMGYSGTDFAAGYPAAHMSLYYSLDLDNGMTAVQGGIMKRSDCAVLIYNCLNAKAKSGKIYASELGYSVDSSNKINYAALTSSLAQGPVVNSGSSISSLVGFEPVSVYKNRRTSSLSSIAYGDVLYYIKDVKTVWAYSDKISGTVQAISPSTASPTSVTVSGITCTLGSSSAVYSFSDLGTVKVGDNVTLLLGVGGQCVYVLSGDSTTQTLYGVVSSVGTKTVTDSYGSSVQDNYITIASTDGNTYNYSYDGSLDEGDVAKVVISDGKISISKAKSSVTLSGTVDNKDLGSYSMDSSTQIIDYLSGRAVSVPVSRLDGVYISQSKVAFCMLDDDGVIDKLILQNVTGDNLDYGVATTVNESSDIMDGSSSYVYIVDGTQKVYSAQVTYNVKEGPCSIEYKSDGTVKSLSSLTGKKVTAMGSYTMTLSGTGEMKKSEDIQTYIKNGDEYYLSSLMNVSLDTHTLTAYYDKEAKNGGCIRIVIATEK
ncbi:MAG: S-layer homology domain-containing protein [Clostridiaceae bacterium]|nr:S-layer homology domain-containing protein [Clostridiaceae bacterium]